MTSSLVCLQRKTDRRPEIVTAPRIRCRRPSRLRGRAHRRRLKNKNNYNEGMVRLVTPGAVIVAQSKSRLSQTRQGHGALGVPESTPTRQRRSVVCGPACVGRDALPNKTSLRSPALPSPTGFSRTAGYLAYWLLNADAPAGYLKVAPFSGDLKRVCTRRASRSGCGVELAELSLQYNSSRRQDCGVECDSVPLHRETGALAGAKMRRTTLACMAVRCAGRR